jgi:hypothetical protein
LFARKKTGGFEGECEPHRQINSPADCFPRERQARERSINTPHLASRKVKKIQTPTVSAKEKTPFRRFFVCAEKDGGI